MLRKNQLHNLTPTELLFLQKHIKLGKEHLERCLTPDEIYQIFLLATVPPKTQKELSATAMEVAGQSSLVVNTILTATLGAWMGLSGFLQFKLGSKPLFAGVLAFSIFVGALVGFQSGKVRKKMSQDALDKRKLQDFEMAILREINKKRRTEINEKTKELISILKSLNVHIKPEEVEKIDNLQESCLNWIAQLDKEMREHYPDNKLTDYFVKELRSDKRFFSQKVKEEEEKDLDTLKFNKITNKLAQSSIQPPVVLRSWIRTNLNRLLVDLTPTVFGGFSSLFVYLGGAPTVARAMGKEALFEFLVRPEIKMLQFIIAISITLYFAFSFLYLTRKAFKRDQELAKMQVLLAREENIMNVLDDRLLKLKEALSTIQPLEHIFHFVKRQKKTG